MARKVMQEATYSLNPTTKTVVIPRIIPAERLILLTDVTANKVIYNFSDPSLKGTVSTYMEGQLTAPITGASTTGTTVTFTAVNTFTPGQTVTVTGVTPASFNLTGTITSATSSTFALASTVTGTWVSGGVASIGENTVIVLNYNTAALGAGDEIQVTLDEFNERVQSSEEQTDPVGKVRMSAPQALIDTDFEYGPQVSKWENLGLINNRPFAYGYNHNLLPVTDILTSATGSKTISVVLTSSAVGGTTSAIGNGTVATYTTATAHGLAVGQQIVISGLTATTGSYNTNSNSPVSVLSVINGTTFTALSSGTGASTGTGAVTSTVVPAVGTPIQILDTFTQTATGNYVAEYVNSAVSATVTVTGGSATGGSAGAVNTIAITATGTWLAGQVVNLTGVTATTGTAPTGNYVITTGGSGSFTASTTNAVTAFSGTVGGTLTIPAQFTYTAKGPTLSSWQLTSIFDTYKTQIVQSTYYAQSVIGTTPTLTYTSGTGAVTVTTSVPHGLSIGNEIAINGTTGLSTAGFTTTNATANGNYSVATITSPTSFVYYIQSGLTGTISSTTTALTATGSNNTNVVTLSAATGVSVGMAVSGTGIQAGTVVTAITGTGATTVVSLSQNLTSAMSATAITFYTSVLARNQSQVMHRAFDGGVMFTSNGGSNNVSQIRQTRRYFRYQSGKGIQMSSGTILKPTYGLDSLTYASSVVTVVTKERHDLQPGYQITVYGANEAGFNGTFTVLNITGLNSFTYTPTTTPTLTTASGSYYVSVNAWNGTVNRLGLFDNQNGLFFEFDGQKLYAVRRHSTFQIAGRVSVTNNSNTVTGATNFATTFNKQLVPGDYIVIRGQSYRVQDIASDTSMTIYPSYRGPSASNVIVSKTIDIKVPQSAWNIDKMDGTGPSEYLLDLTKMQMFFVDFSWYGAGAVRWGLRGPRGNIVYVHKMANNNVNPMAYMRSGNLPGRYESTTLPASTQITANIATTDTTINVADTSKFYAASASAPGCAVVRNGSNYEFINYIGLTSNSLTGVTRGQAGATGLTLSVSAGSANATGITSTAGLQVGMRVISPSLPDGTFILAIPSTTTLTLSQGAISAVTSAIVPAMGVTTGSVGSTSSSATSTGTAFTYSATAPVVVEQAYPTYGPSISHWGTSVIMDGRFDDDKSLLFTYGQTTPTILGSSTPLTYVFASGGASGQATVVVTVTAGTTIATGALITGTGVTAGTYITNVAQTTTTTYTLTLSNNLTAQASGNYVVSGGTTKALMSIRIAPSVDGGYSAGFGSRELLNRMQLQLKTLDISLLNTATGNVLVQAYLNGNAYNISSLTNTQWTNAVRNALVTPNSSLAQVADFAGGNYIVQGGEVTGGFFVSSTGTSDISSVRDLGNAILGGGTSYSNNGVYPDGPDVLTIVVTNVSSTAASVLGRLSWTEAQA